VIVALLREAELSNRVFDRSWSSVGEGKTYVAEWDATAIMDGSGTASYTALSSRTSLIAVQWCANKLVVKLRVQASNLGDAVREVEDRLTSGRTDPSLPASDARLVQLQEVTGKRAKEVLELGMVTRHGVKGAA